MVHAGDLAARPLRNSPHQRWMERHSHAHANPELLLCLRGRSVFGLGGRAYPCGPGSVFVINPFEPHDSGYARNADGLEHLWVAILEDQMIAWRVRIERGRMIPLPQARWALNVPDVAGSLSVLNRPAQDMPADLLKLELMAAVAAIAARIVQAERSGPPPQAQGSPRLDQKLQVIRRHIEQTAGKGASLENLARLAGYSRFHFLRLFRQCYGLTVHQYINACRAKRVGELLGQGVAKKVIAVELGFSCPAAFSRWCSTHRSNRAISSAAMK